MIKGELHRNIDEEASSVSQILKRPTAGIINSGSLIIFLFVVFVFTGMWFIKYPDIISAEAIIKTNNDAVPVYTNTQGQISEILVNENDSIEENSPLFIINTELTLSRVKSLENELKTLLSSLNDKAYTNLIELDFDKTLNYYELNGSYAQFTYSLTQFIRLNLNNELAFKLETKTRELTHLLSIGDNLKTQIDVYDSINVLSKSEFELHQYEYEQSLISKSEFNEYQRSALNARIPLVQARNNFYNNALQIEGKRQEIMAIKSEIQKSKEELELAVKNMVVSVEEWQLEHVISAPTSGYITFYKNVLINEYFDMVTDPVLFIQKTATVSKGPQFYCELQLPLDRFGNIEVGYDVAIDVAGYPANNYGKVLGEVIWLSDIIQGEKILIKVQLDSGLTTTTGYEIPFRTGLKGLANVIEDDKNVLERVFEKLL